jgi:hypothetical protein
VINKPDNTHVKILVYREPKDGYPSEEWEGLWAVPLGEGLYKVDNIPFYAMNISWEDVVEAEYQDNLYILKRLVQPSENSTIRVVVYDLANEDDVRKRISEMGCAMEGSGIPGLIAVNVPKASIEKVLIFLNDAFEKEQLDFEEGVLR